MNLINNLCSVHCFGSPRTRHITGGKITMFKLGHPVFDGGIRWCIFPWCFFQNGMNFLRCLALHEKETWWQLMSQCCWNRARCLTCFLSASVTRNDLQFSTWTGPSFQRHFFFFFNRHCNPCGFWPAQLSLSILSRKVFTECRCQRHVKPPTWRTSD